VEFFLQSHRFKYFDHCGLLQCAQGAGWRVVASFEGVLPKRIKGLPLDSMFELSSVKKVSSLVLLKVVFAVFASSDIFLFPMNRVLRCILSL